MLYLLIHFLKMCLSPCLDYEPFEDKYVNLIILFELRFFIYKMGIAIAVPSSEIIVGVE